MWTRDQKGIGSSSCSLRKISSNRFHDSHSYNPEDIKSRLPASPELIISVNRSGLKMFNMVNGIWVHADSICSSCPVPLDRKYFEVSVNCESFENIVVLYKPAFLCKLCIGCDSSKG